MSVQFELEAQPRDQKGTPAARRFRHNGQVPAVIYGAGQDNEALLLSQNELMHQLGVEAFHSAIISIKVNGGVQKAIVRDVQMHPYRPMVMHVDFQRVSETEELRINVPVHFVGEDDCPGVKLEGGIVSHLATDVEVVCLPSALPEYLEIDVSGLHLHQSLNLSDIKVPEGVELTALAHGGEDQPIVAVLAPKVVEEEEEVEGEAIEGEELAAAGEAPEEKEGDEESSD